MLKISNLSKSFGSLSVLEDLNLTVNTGEVAVIIGPSGTGKSTFLRCINFLETPTTGDVQLDEIRVNAENIHKKDVLELRRATAMVFQNYNLFQNKTAIENIMEPMITAQKLKKTQAKEKALEILELISLSDKADSYPSQLSGGQQQRIGIGRAIGTSPRVILFDEPTSSLDPQLVGEVLDVIKRLAQQKITMLITTHEMEFARSIADKVLFMDQGRFIESGTAREIFEEAKNPKTRRFLKSFY